MSAQVAPPRKVIDLPPPSQYNGLWGTPLNLVSIRNAYLPEQPALQVLQSALWRAIGQEHPAATWTIEHSSKTGFWGQINEGQTRYYYRCHYHDYQLEGTRLLLYDQPLNRDHIFSTRI